MTFETSKSASAAEVDQPNDSITAVTLSVTITPKISFTFYQNSVPVLCEIVIINDIDTALNDLGLTISFDPAFLKTHTSQLSFMRIINGKGSVL